MMFSGMVARPLLCNLVEDTGTDTVISEGCSWREVTGNVEAEELESSLTPIDEPLSSPGNVLS